MKDWGRLAGRHFLDIASFTTEPEVCPYLHDRPARQRVSITTNISLVEYSELLAAGWRRFGRVLFRPACGSCRECVPIRVLAREFQPSKSQRRVLRKNRDVDVEIGAPTVDQERLQLYRRFHRERARTRDWPYREMDPEEYADTFVENAAFTLEFRYRLQGSIAGIAYVGESRDAFNSIYAFTDPEYAKRGLGNYDVLTEIAEAARRGKRYVYLGFLVAGCRSMAYKSAFRPHEVLVGGRWRPGE